MFVNAQFSILAKVLNRTGDPNDALGHIGYILDPQYFCDYIPTQRHLYISVVRIVNICGQQDKDKEADGPKETVFEFDQNNNAASIVRSLVRKDNKVRAAQLYAKDIRRNFN